jgi:MFS family permease
MTSHGSTSPTRPGPALAVLAATQLMVILDGTIVNVALPTIRGGLGFSGSGLAWVVNGFFVAFALVLLPAGRLGDLVGPRRVFLAGLVLFTAASAWCGLAWDPASLVVARFAQGLGGGLTSAVVLGMISTLYADPAARARAYALLACVGSAGASIGVVAGGLLTELASWRWVFLVNVPFGIAVLVAALRVVDDTRGTGLRAGLAPGGSLLPRGVFADRRFAIVNAVLFTMTVAGFSFQFLTALYLQDVLGFAPVRTGLSYLTVTIAIAIASLGLSGRLAQRYGAERVLVAGLLLFVVGMLFMARLPDDGGYLLDVAPGFVVMGAGFGLAMPQAVSLAMAAVAPEHGGVASGFVNTTQQAGGAIGLAVVSVVAVSGGRAAGFLVAAGALAVGLALATSLTRGRRPDAIPTPRPASLAGR